MPEHVFITGASGCVGHYLLDELAGDPRYHLHLLVRDAARLRFPYQDHANVSLVGGDFLDLERHAPLLATMDHVVHVAAAWGEAVAYQVNYRLAHRLFDMVDPRRIRRMINFSTASILDFENRLLPEAGRCGTDYIKSKYQCLEHLDEHPNAARIVTVFPTLIFGGSPRHPVSHLSSGLSGLRSWLPILRRVTLDGTLHFIHARDIARMTKHLLEHEPTERHLVLGNPALSVDSMIEQICAAYGRPRKARHDLTPLLGPLSFFFQSRMNPWDHFSMRYRHFRYRAVGPADFGLPQDLATIQGVLREQGVLT